MDDEARLVRLATSGWRYALTLTGDATQADDLIQEAFAAILSAGGALSRAYLHRAIRSRWIDRWRRRQPILEEVGLDELAVPQGGTARLEAAEALAPAWAELRAEEREALHLCVVEGYTAAEAADLMGCPRNTVLSHCHRGRAKLREALADREVTS